MIHNWFQMKDPNLCLIFTRNDVPKKFKKSMWNATFYCFSTFTFGIGIKAGVIGINAGIFVKS